MTNLYDPRIEYGGGRMGGGWDPKDQQAVEASVNEYMQSDEYKRRLAERQANMSDSGNASEPARLEDLAPRLLEAMLQIATEKADTDYDTIYKPLYELGLVEYDESDEDSRFIGIDILTAKGRRWVADYQQRQAQTPADALVGDYEKEHKQRMNDWIMDTIDIETDDEQELANDYELLESVLADVKNQLATIRAELMQKVSEESHRNKSATIDRLRAELATVRAELQAAREREATLVAETKQYRELLNAALQFAPKGEPQLWKANENHMYADSLYTLGMAIHKLFEASGK